MPTINIPLELGAHGEDAGAETLRGALELELESELEPEGAEDLEELKESEEVEDGGVVGYGVVGRRPERGHGG